MELYVTRIVAPAPYTASNAEDAALAAVPMKEKAGLVRMHATASVAAEPDAMPSEPQPVAFTYMEAITYRDCIENVAGL